MLNYTNRDITLLAVSITVLIFVVIVFADLCKLQNYYYKYYNVTTHKGYTNMQSNTKQIQFRADSPNIKNYQKIYSNVKDEKVYTEIMKVANMYSSKTEVETSKKEKTEEKLEEKIEEKTQEKAKEKNNASSLQNTIKQAKQSNSINIYSTNKWRIKIPKLKLDAPISEGTTQEAMRRTVGHFTMTDKWTGNVALAAHNRGYKCNFFQEIKKLQKGDTIIYSTEKGQRTYKVETNKVIEETDWTYIKNTKDNRITLITCETNQRAYRRCIQAVEVI